MVVSFRSVANGREPPSVLDVVRSLFVYINTEARPLSESRRILLDDESVNAIAVQELLERAHDNDLRPRRERREECLPLLFFDWRGQELGGKPVPMAAAVKSVGEIRSWFEDYLLGEDFSEYQEEVLRIETDERLKSAFGRQRLDYRTTRLVRKRVATEVLPAVSYLLENFEPYREYIGGLRELEARYDGGSALQCHAFDRLRFGSQLDGEVPEQQLEEIERSLLLEIERLRREALKPAFPIDNDIGMRGVMQSFGELVYRWTGVDWLEYAEWFTGSLNEIHRRGWFEAGYGGKAHGVLRHVIVNENENVINYRLQDASGALGAYVSLFVGTCFEPPPHWCADWPEVRGELRERLKRTMRRGHRREVRRELREEFPEGGRPLTEAVNREADDRVVAQMESVEGALGRVALIGLTA